MKIFGSVALLILLSITLAVYSPKIIIRIYKLAHIKYVRITKNDFEKRFTNTELLAAIENAKSQSWVQQQISDDLAPYKHGLNYDQVNQWFNELQENSKNKLVKFIVNGTTVTTESAPELKNTRPYKTVYSVISILANKKLIPNCTFIVALNDYLAYVPPNHSQPAAIFSFAKHTQIPIEKNTILIPDWMNLRYWEVLRGRIDLANRIFPWQNKKNLIHWRGGCADSMQHRNKLIQLNTLVDFLDVGMTEGSNPASYVDPEFSVQYKYQIALDGARCTWERMVWQMYSNTVLIKPNSPQVQWFHRGLVPYVNYVPITDVTLNDISNIYAWLHNNDAAAKNIMLNANKFARENFKTQDFFAYYALLLNEYAKLFVT